MNPIGARPHEQVSQGALLILASSGLFALMGAAIKVVSDHLPLEMIVFFRNFFGLITLSPWLMQAGRDGIRTDRLELHGFRTIVGLAAMYCFFYALAHLQLGEAVLLNFSAPLFVPLIAFLWLREPVPPGLRWALAIGLLGIALILKPTAGMLQPTAFVALASGFFASLALVSVRDLSKTEPPERTVFYFGALATIVSAIPLLWSWHQPTPNDWALLLGIGVLATAAQVMLTRGITKVPAGQVGPFAYSTVVFSAAIGWIVWEEIFDMLSILGGVTVCVAGILVLRANHTARTIQSA